jgi:hypothetical protein
MKNLILFFAVIVTVTSASAQETIKYKGRKYQVVDASTSTSSSSDDCTTGDCEKATTTKVIVNNTKSEAELEIEAQKADAATDANAAYRSRTAQENADRDAQRSAENTRFIVGMIYDGVKTVYTTERMVSAIDGLRPQSQPQQRQASRRRSHTCSGYDYEAPTDYVEVNKRRTSSRRTYSRRTPSTQGQGDNNQIPEG